MRARAAIFGYYNNSNYSIGQVTAGLTPFFEHGLLGLLGLTERVSLRRSDPGIRAIRVLARQPHLGMLTPLLAMAVCSLRF
jgi:hypothetical protein